MTPHLRPAARALLVDPSDRVLLLRFEFADEHVVWAAPGGGVEATETLRQGLARELEEEVGVVPPPDAPHVWHQRVVAPGHAAGYDGVINDYFLIRVDSAFEPGGTFSAADLQAENVYGYRWWSLVELLDYSGPELFSPRALPVLLQELLSRGTPAEPLVLGL